MHEGILDKEIKLKNKIKMAKVKNKWDQVSPTEKLIGNVIKVVAAVVFFITWFTTIYILITQ
jgi:hypothetical protein